MASGVGIMQSGGHKQGSGLRSFRLFPSLAIVLKRLGPFCVACFRLPKGYSCGLLFFCLRACVWAYHQTSSYAADSETSLVPLQDTAPSLFRYSKDLSGKEATQSLCRWNTSIRQAFRSMFGKLSSTQSLDGARRTCFDRLHARVSTVERQSNK